MFLIWSMKTNKIKVWFEVHVCVCVCSEKFRIIQMVAIITVSLPSDFQGVLWLIMSLSQQFPSDFFSACSISSAEVLIPLARQQLRSVVSSCAGSCNCLCVCRCHQQSFNISTFILRHLSYVSLLYPKSACLCPPCLPITPRVWVLKMWICQEI